jgi:hypothetical protein
MARTNREQLPSAAAISMQFYRGVVSRNRGDVTLSEFDLFALAWTLLAVVLVI